MLLSLVIVAWSIVGGMCYGGFSDAVSSFREEMDRNGAWTKRVGRTTVESVLDGLEKIYTDFSAKSNPTVKDLNILIEKEYHMYSIINQETSLRTESPLIKFLKQDLDERLDAMADSVPGNGCPAAVSQAKSSLAGPYNYRSQANILIDVRNKCAS